MYKLLIILLIALIFEAIGVVFLNQGIKQVGEVSRISAAEILRVVGRGATNGRVLLGIFFESLFFAGLLVLMSKAEVSFLWPLTSLGFVLTTLAAKFILQENVSLSRWCGVALIMAGAGLITWSEQTKPHGVSPGIQESARTVSLK
jgi:uncharacterized membrane protein